MYKKNANELILYMKKRVDMQRISPNELPEAFFDYLLTSAKQALTDPRFKRGGKSLDYDLFLINRSIHVF